MRRRKKRRAAGNIRSFFDELNRGLAQLQAQGETMMGLLEAQARRLSDGRGPAPTFMSEVKTVAELKRLFPKEPGYVMNIRPKKKRKKS